MVHSLSPATRSASVSGPCQSVKTANRSNSLITRLGYAIEACLTLAIVVPPFIFGGREAVGQLLLALIVLFAFGLWIARRIIQGPGLIPLSRPEIILVLGALMLLVVSRIPLPAGVVRNLAPGIDRLLPNWQNGALGDLGSEGWRTLSLTPGLTVEGFFLFALYVLLFWITLDVVRTRASAQRLLVALFVTGIGVASVGLLHYLFWNGKFYGHWTLWWVDLERQVRAPFTNRNHFAGFLALAIPPGIVTLLGLFRRWKNTTSFGSSGASGCRRPHELVVLLAGFGLIVIFTGLFLSQSRGGTMVGVVAVAATTFGLLRSGSNKASSLALMALLFAGGIGIVLATAGQEPFQRSAALLTDNQSLDELSNQRFRLWTADLQALGDFPLTGTGVGSHAQVYPLYLENSSRLTFTHAESGYVQVLTECGLAGGVLLLLSICCVGHNCWQGLRAEAHRRERGRAAIVLATSVSLLAAMTHGAVDFVWYVPAYAACLAVLLGLAFSAYRNHAFASASREPVPPPSASLAHWAWRLGLPAIWLLVSVLVADHFVSQWRIERAWNDYFDLLPESNEKDPSTDISIIQKRVVALTEACQNGSADPDVHFRMGLSNLELFLQRQGRTGAFSLDEARAYLQAESFRDPTTAQAWLKKAYGPDLDLLETARASFRRSLQCCPLNGQAYVRLAQLHFLDGVRLADSQACCQQALLVRPNDSDVHLQVGLEAWLAGDQPSAQNCWGKACRWQSECKWRVLPILAERLSAEQAADFLPPDFDGLKWLARNQLASGHRSGLPHVLQQVQKALEIDAERTKSAGAWLELHELYRDANLAEPAEAALRTAIQHAPRNANYQLRLIQWHMDRDQWDVALEEAQTARRLFPQNTEFQNLLRNILAMKKEPAPAPKKPRLHSASKPP
jgi:O-antigen ligase/tetratricopeptide (TPR) repeat protein